MIRFVQSKHPPDSAGPSSLDELLMVNKGAFSPLSSTPNPSTKHRLTCSELI